MIVRVAFIASTALTIVYAKDPSPENIKSAMAAEAARVCHISPEKPLHFGCVFDNNLDLERLTNKDERPDGFFGIKAVVQQVPKTFGCSATADAFKHCASVALIVADSLHLCTEHGREFDACSFGKAIGSPKSEACKAEEVIKKTILKQAKDGFFSKESNVVTVEVRCNQQGFVDISGKDLSGNFIKGMGMRDICDESTRLWGGTSMNTSWDPCLKVVKRVMSVRRLCPDKPKLQSLDDFQKLFE